MENNFTQFFCKACEHEWQGQYIPLYCPNCETVRQIAIDIGEEGE